MLIDLWSVSSQIDTQQGVPTCSRNIEYGNPLSRAKAQVRRDAEARSPNVENTLVNIKPTVIAVVAFLELVAL